MNNIHLEKLTWDTVDDVLKLKVSKEQRDSLPRTATV